MHKNKLVVVGVGHVGSYVLADAMKLRLFAEIATIDILKDVAHGEALDQAHATALTYMSNVDVHAGITPIARMRTSSSSLPGRVS